MERPGVWGRGSAPAAPRTRRHRPAPVRPWFPAGLCAATLPFPRARPGPGAACFPAQALPVSPRSPCRRGCSAWAAGPGVPLLAGSACSCGRWWAAARPRRGAAAPKSGRCTAQVTHPGPPRVSAPAASPGCPCPGHSPQRCHRALGRPAGRYRLVGCGLVQAVVPPLCLMLLSAGGPEKGSGAGEGSGVQVP